MSNLTKERLEEIASGQNTVSISEAVEFARELLSLRTAGDEEVRESTTTSLNQRLSQAFDAGNAVEFSIAAADAVVYAETLDQTNERLHNRNKAQGARIKELEHELNSLSNQLRDAQAEIERLKEQVDSRVPSLVAQIATLTAERDEALEGVRTLTETVNRLNGQNDRLRQELAALKSAPGMEEVDAILNDTEKSSEQIESELADLARRSIAAREEVVGLLDQMKSDIRDVFSDDWCLLDELKNLSRCDTLQPYAAAHRLLAIACCPEIVEGK